MSGKRKPQNPVIGHWQCPIGGRAIVRQATKRGRHFYTQCDCCGVQMGTAAQRQTKIWQEAEFSPPDGVTVYKPNNVNDEHQAPANLPAPGEFEAVDPEKPASPEAAERWKPGQSEPAEGDQEPEQPTSGNRGALVALGVAAIAAIGGAWMG
ncbi:hypothetical protein [Streptomyces sp. B29(2018)]|uniref:hypothetical protein n=1 Tax=Streptomyces sp. B29(2018) TaxID=2485016 RepID=UPI000FD6265C|nr:hypothetical protein [Streptomyces sp. B29(2018)]